MGNTPVESSFLINNSTSGLTKDEVEKMINSAIDRQKNENFDSYRNLKD